MIKKNLLGIVIIAWGIVMAILRLTEVIDTTLVGSILIIGFGVILFVNKLLKNKNKAGNS